MKNKSIWSGLFKLLFIGAIGSFLFFAMAPKIENIMELAGRRDSLQQEVNQLKKKNQELKTTMENMDSPETVEKIAREKLGMVKPGEKIIVPVTADRP